MTHKSRTDKRGVFELGSKVGHVTRHAQQLFMDERSKVKVTKSRDVSADKNAITRQSMVISTSNLVGIIDVGVDACGILCRSVGQTKPEVEIWRTFKILNAKINVKRRQIAEILHSNNKSGSANRKAVSKFTPEQQQQQRPFNGL